jgi:uncharacterized protein YkwD
MGSDDRDTAKKMMMVNHFQKMISIVICALVLYSCASSPPQIHPALFKKQPQPKISEAGLEMRIHTLINIERKKHGLSQLEWDNALAGIGRNHSKDMVLRNYFDHSSPEGHDFAYRYRREGFQCSVRVGNTIYAGAENIALNNQYASVTTVNGEAFYDWNSQDKIAETAVQGWMNSTGHRKNILMPHWTREGIGVVFGPDGKIAITQNFC